MTQNTVDGLASGKVSNLEPHLTAHTAACQSSRVLGFGRHGNGVDVVSLLEGIVAVAEVTRYRLSPRYRSSRRKEPRRHRKTMLPHSGAIMTNVGDGYESPRMISAFRGHFAGLVLFIPPGYRHLFWELSYVAA